MGHAESGDHVITRSVRDSAAMLDASAGPDTGVLYYAAPPGPSFLSDVGANPGKLRIAFTSKPFLGGAVDGDCLKGLDATAKLCADLGHEVVEAAPQIDGKAFARAFLRVVCVETRAAIEEAEVYLGRKASYKDFEPSTWVIGLLGRQCRAPDFSKSLNLTQLMARQIGRFFEEYDILLTPTLAMPPLARGAPSRKVSRLWP